MQYISMDMDNREDFKMIAQENAERFEDAMSSFTIIIIIILLLGYE